MGYTIYLVWCIHLGTGWKYYACHLALKSRTFGPMKFRCM